MFNCVSKILYKHALIIELWLVSTRWRWHVHWAVLKDNIKVEVVRMCLIMLDCLLSSCKVAHVMCLTSAVCRCGAGSFHCLLGATESMFSSQVSWKLHRSGAKHEQRAGEGRLIWRSVIRDEQSVSRLREEERKHLHVGGDHCGFCEEERREAVNSWQGQGEVQKKEVPLHLIMRIALSFPIPIFIETNFEIKSFILG